MSLSTLIVLALMPFLAVLLEGFRRKFIGRMQNRVGPPLLQGFYDVIKLWQKKTPQGRNFLFNAMPWLALINALALLAFVPFSFIGFELDFLVFGYLFILLDSFFIFGVFASKSPFGFHAAVREFLLMLGYEISFLIVMAIFLSKAGVASLAAYDVELMFLQMPLASLGLLAVGLVVLKVTPFDVVEAKPEISGGFFTEFYGKKLALIELAELIKNLAFYLVLGILLVGRLYAIPLTFFFTFLYALSYVTSPRYSTFKTVKLLLALTVFLFMDLFLLW